ncbi:LOW QUALITY PROTEIN: cadherin-23-like [Ptychodera flava]|uniref:LOW QUALITY PROTEIN: cadherin-23-like n=1 Tax=Ptychodera flava TaxID=63121 RepID=UPI00396A7E18
MHRGSEIGTLVGEDPEGSPVTYGVKGDAGNFLFNVGPDSGVVTLKNSVDRESRDRYTVQVTISDGINEVTNEVRIFITDVNDNAPMFQNTPYRTSITEDMPVGSTVIQFNASDPDSSVNRIFYFALSEETEYFQVNTVYTTPSVETGIVTLKKSLDYESKNIYELTVVALDYGTPQQSSQASLIIKVEDVQDTPPIFTGLPYTTSVYEDASIGELVQIIGAYDQDTGVPNEIQYSIVSGNSRGLFSLGSSSGEIRVAQHIDREAEDFPGYVDLTVKAKELGPDGGAFVETTFTIGIIDINDEVPTFDQSDYSITISESSLVDSVLPMNIHVKDGDQSEFGRFQLSLHGEHAGFFRLEPLFALGETDVKLLVERPLDYETTRQFDLVIYANESADSTHYDSAQITILLTNENDNRPVFEPQSVVVDIFEDLPIGSNVTMVTATDDDIGQYGEITYSLSGSDKFQIDQLTGVITLAGQVDYERSLSYQLTVQAEDGGDPPREGNARVIVNIIDVNDNAPEFQRQEYFTSIDENTLYLPADNSVLRIRATDKDSPPYNQLTYYMMESLPDGSIEKVQNGSEFIVITTAGSGYLYVVSPLDYESVTDGRMTLSLLAEDIGGLSASAVVTVEILDKNDHGPVFTQSTYNASIPENMLSGDVVTVVTAIDGDLSAAFGNDSIVYSVSQSSLFRVNARSGEITTAGFLDRDEGNDLFAVEVLAVDGGHGMELKSATATVYIKVTDVNDNNPVFDQVRQTVLVAEDEPIGAVVANVSASDLDEGINGYVMYSLIGGNINDAFMIDADNGEIKIQSQLDYDETTQVYVLEILAKDGGMPVTPATGSATATVTVSVLDVNDNAPVFIYETPGLDSYQFAVSEEADPGINVGVVTATDLDSTLNGKIDYNITAGNVNDTFNMKRIDSGEIILERLLDREMLDTYNLIITAIDRGTIPRSATCSVLITVKDVNDNDPVWLGEPYTVVLDENTPNGTFVFKVSATDADIGVNQKLVYEMNNDNIYYEVDSETGIIRTQDVPVDRETNNLDMREIVLTVKDSGRPLRRSPDTATVFVNILDANDNTPVFENIPYIARVTENLPATTSIFQVLTFDPDLGENGTVSYTITKTDPDENHFTIESSTGIIRLVQPLDREHISNYTVTIEAVDGGISPNVAMTTLQIIVEDDNDHTPVFNASSYQVTVAENATRYTKLLTVFATDGDIGSNAEINYFIGAGNEDGKFRMDFETGLLETAAYLDREAVSSYSLTIEAVDNGAVPRTGSSVVMVTVIDVNDNRPVFVDSNYDVTVPEDVSQDTVIVAVSAEDEDIGENAKIFYSIEEGNTDDCFVIDNDTGDIRRSDRPLDRETEESFMLIVAASNGDSETLRSTVRVSIRVSDVNDETPVFSQSVYNRPDLSENAGSGTSVVLVSAEDPDLNEGGIIHYSIASGNDAGKFSIGFLTGLITTQDDLDFETQRNYTLVVMATDQAPPFHSAVAKVIVQIVNTNDEPPAFNLSRYEGTVRENVEIGTPVLRVEAVEYDNQNPIRYEMDPNANPEAMRLFKIDAVTGVISTDGEIDREVRSFYTISILADDGGIDKGSTTVWITVIDENDNSPVFDGFSDLRVSVREEQFTPVNSIIATIKATDQDEGSNAEINYSILSGNEDEAFAIFKNAEDESEVRNVKNLDRERQNIYIMVISAYDSGTPSQSSTMVLTVIVEDVNDNAPVFNMSYSYVATIDENVGGGTLVTTVHANDADKLGLNGLKYYITAGNTDETFRMDRNTGEITTRPSPPDRERQDFYNLTVLVQDEEYNQIQQTYTQVLVYIADKNDNSPVFDPASYSASVLEGPGSNAIRVVDVNATDQDLAENAELVFAIHSGDVNDMFSINPNTGEIMTSQELDREVADEYLLVITATDQALTESERLTGTTTVTITVEDVNDVAPYFQSLYFGPYDIAEDTSGPFVGTFLAMDEDKGVNGQIQYSLLGSVNDYFSISPSDGDLRVKKGVELDREQTDVYNITIVAEDRGTPSLSGTTIVQVMVSDINDNDPVFIGTPYMVEISEHITMNASIFTVTATDNDIGPNSRITYSITNGNTEHAFAVEPTTGIVRVKKHTLDREITDQYVLTITAKDNPDNPTNARRDGTELIVNILDENDQPPVFSQTSYTGSVMENAPGIPVTMDTPILAEDADIGSNAVVQYSITGDGSGYFTIDEGTGVLTVKSESQLDRETESSYTFTVQAFDVGGLNSAAEVVVEILDENDNIPIFVPASSTSHVPENAQEGVEVAQVSASDEDSGLNQQVTYRIESGGQDRFTINANTGLIKIAPGQTLDREEQDKYMLVVIATDRGDPAQSGTGIVEVMVDDINDTPPFFATVTRSIDLPEDAPVGLPVFMALAIDPDVDSLLQFSIISVSAFDEEDVEIQDPDVFDGWFEIDQYTGDVSVEGVLDRESVSTLVLTISATDLNSLYPDRSTSQPNLVLTIRLTDVNDNDPVFMPEGVTFIHEKIVEQTPRGTVVTTVQALDADKGVNSRLRYQIINNSTDMLVIPDTSSGLIIVNGDIDRKDHSWLNFTVRASDMGEPPRSSDIPVYIEIVEVNDNNPEFEKSLYEAAILENATIGDMVTVVTATDPDTGSFGEIRYSVVGGGGKFTINSFNGTVRLASALDREVKTEYTLTVTAKDNPAGILSNRRENSVLVVVTVLDVNDNTPVPTASAYNFEIQENRAPLTLVGMVTASDADSGDNGALVYTVLERNDDNLLYIDSSTGEIFAIEPLDRETIVNDGVITMKVQISDQGMPPRVNVSVEITVLDVNDNNPYFEHPLYNVTLSESDFGGTVVFRFSAVDIDQNQVLSYSLLDEHLYDEFYLSAQTGTLTTVKSLDYESRPEYLLTIEAKDQDGRRGQTQLHITISDTNDQAPIFEVKFYQTSIRENVPPGTSVGQVIATDADSIREHSVILYYIIGGNHDDVFRVDEQSGEVKTNKALDREDRAEYELDIEARNLPISRSINSNKTLNDFATMIVSVEDVNDVAPIFTKPNYTRRVLENEQTGTIIIEVTAVDLDEGSNGKVFYEIIGGNNNDQFNIDRESGALTLAKLFQRNVQIGFRYDLLIRASDYGTPPLSSNTSVLLQIVDVNDRKPVFINPRSNQTLSIPENRPPGYFITQVIAEDGDLGDNGAVHYGFFETEGENQDWKNFYIHEDNGNLYTTFTADREEKTHYTIVLLAKDLGEPQFETTLTVVIHVEDENDNTASFPDVGFAQTMFIAEHSSRGSVVGHIVPAVDPDEGENARVYYFIIDGNEEDIFYMFKDNGTIILNEEIDRETSNQFVLIVKASDDPDYGVEGPTQRKTMNSSNFDYRNDDPTLKMVIIDIVDINDNGPVFTKQQYTAGLSIDAKYESELITVVAVDADTGNNSKLHYSIISSFHVDTTSDADPRAVPDAFKIGKLDGVVRTNKLFVTFYHGYFELQIYVEDISHQNDTTIVKIYMLKDIQRVKMVFNFDPDTVKDFKEQLISLISNVTGALIHVDDIQYHISDDSEVDFGKTDMLIHAVDPHTNTIMDVHHVIEIIDENYSRLENLFKVYNVIEIVPAIPPREHEDITLLQAALVTIGILLFMGVFIYTLCICWIKHKHRRKLEAIATFSFGASTSDLLRDSSYQGSNPLWIDNYSWISDWPDSLSHTDKEYEAQEITMDFFHDDEDSSHRGHSKQRARTPLVTFSPVNGVSKQPHNHTVQTQISRSPSNSDAEIEIMHHNGDSDTDDSQGLLSGNSTSSLSEPELNGEIVPMRELTIDYSSRRALTPISEEDSSSLSSVSKTDTVKTGGSQNSGSHADDEAENGSSNNWNDRQYKVKVVVKPGDRNDRRDLGTTSRQDPPQLFMEPSSVEGYHPLDSKESDNNSMEQNISDSDSVSSSGSEGACQIYHVNPEHDEIGLNIPVDGIESDEIPLTVSNEDSDLAGGREPGDGLANPGFQDDDSLPDSQGDVELGNGITNDAFEGDDNSVPDSDTVAEPESANNMVNVGLAERDRDAVSVSQPDRESPQRDANDEEFTSYSESDNDDRSASGIGNSVFDDVSSLPESQREDSDDSEEYQPVEFAFLKNLSDGSESVSSKDTVRSARVNSERRTREELLSAALEDEETYI